MHALRRLPLLLWLFAAPVWAQSLQSTQEPNADTSVVWSCSGADCGTGNYAAINDDDTGDYIYTAGNGNADTYDTTDNEFAGTVSYVRLRVHAQRGEGGAAATCNLKHGASSCATMALTLAAGWGTTQQDFSNDCGGGSWEDSELDALQIVCTNGAAKQTNIAWADAEVWGTAAGAGVVTLVDAEPIGVNNLVDGGLAR